MKLVLYTADWCKPCTELKKWMVSHKVKDVRILDVDVDTCPVGQFTKLPTLVVNDTELLVGREQIKPFLESLNGY